MHTLGFSESSALTTGFIVMVVLFVLSEAGYRMGWLSWKYVWRLNANARWALRNWIWERKLLLAGSEPRVRPTASVGHRITMSGQSRIAGDDRTFHDILDLFGKTSQLQIGRDVLDLIGKRAEQNAALLREIAQVSLDLQQTFTRQERKGEDVVEVLVAKHLELDRLLQSLLQSLESEREVVETTRQHLEQQRELVRAILSQSKDSEPG